MKLLIALTSFLWISGSSYPQIDTFPSIGNTVFGGSNCLYINANLLINKDHH